MLYSEYLVRSAEDVCHFCNPRDRKFIENEGAFLTYGIAPYHKHHLLVIPKRHVQSFMELARDEAEQIWDIIRKASAILLELGYESYTVVVREGKNDAKSMKHLHYHIIPEEHIGDLDHEGNKRVVMSEKEIQAVSQDIQKAMQKLTFTGL
ncbi:MAG: HIT domain-containing protein [Candidatus Moranbacteria bacterium]|nr:HIT domain-containing protein [Candidatus Moranbacteria bacterium]